MKRKPIFIILATLACVWALWSGALATYFEKKGDGTSLVVLKIDKNAKGLSAVQHFLQQASVAAGNGIRAAFSAAGGSALVQKCKEDPIVSGGLFIFFGVSLCGIGFIVHMIRTDSRF